MVNQYSGGWTDDDEAYLREYYGVLSIRCIAEALGRTEGACRQHARLMGLASEQDHRPWSPVELDWLRENYVTSSFFDLCAALLRSRPAISRQANTMGLKKPRGRHGKI